MLEFNTYADNRNFYISKYDLILFRIPKVAGTSLWQISANLLGYDISEEKEMRQLTLPSISTVLLPNHNIKYRMAFIRNPWDRLLSCYLQKKKKNSNWFFERNNLSIDMTFGEFAKAVCKIPDHESDRHFRSQFTFIADKDGVIIPNIIGEFSNFKSDLIAILKKINAPQLEIPHWNKTKQRNYTDYYSPELIELVATRYEIDIELFGYKFGKPIRPDFAKHVQREISQDLRIKMLKYKTNKLHHCLKKINERSIIPPNNFRERFRILIKGR